HPRLKEDEQRERKLDVRELPARSGAQRLHEQCPGVLEIRDHDHRHKRCAKLEPAVVDVHRTTSSARGTPRCCVRSSSSFAQAYTARVAGIDTPTRSPNSTTAPAIASSSIGRPASRSCSIDVL